MNKKICTLLLAAVIMIVVSACKSENDEIVDLDLSYDEQSEYVYNEAFGTFWDIYQTAKQAESTSERFAYMALAEGKMLGSAVMVPLTANGGQYTISRQAPNTMNYTLWGNDNEKVHNTIVCNELISAKHRTEMKKSWNELKGTGTYEEWAKNYLTDNGYTLKDTYTVSYATGPLHN